MYGVFRHLGVCLRLIKTNVLKKNTQPSGTAFHIHGLVAEEGDGGDSARCLST